MRPSIADEGNAAASVLSTAGVGTSGDGTAGPEDRIAAPTVRLVGGNRVCGAGADVTGTVAVAAVINNIFVNLTLSANHPVHPCTPAKSSAHAYTQNCARICTQHRTITPNFPDHLLRHSET